MHPMVVMWSHCMQKTKYIISCIVGLTILSYWAVGADTLDKDAKLFALLVPSHYHHAQSVGLCSSDGDIHCFEPLSTGGEVTVTAGGGGVRA